MPVSQCLQMLGMLDDNAGLLLNDFGFGNYLRERNLTGKVVTENFEQRCCVKNIKLLLTVWLLGWSSQVWSDDFFDLGFGDFEEELIVAQDDGKQAVFVFFEMDDCPFCQRMQETILLESDVIAYYRQHFKSYRFDIEGSSSVIDFDGTEFDSGKEMAEKKYRVRATPVMMFFDLEGRPVARYTGPTSSKEEFMLLGKYVVSGSYKEMPFTRYKRSKPQ